MYKNELLCISPIMSAVEITYNSKWAKILLLFCDIFVIFAGDMMLHLCVCFAPVQFVGACRRRMLVGFCLPNVHGKLC